MTVFKCKMCGANLEVSENQSVITCEYCSTQQTLPKFDDDRKITLFTRANHLRFNCEFDKAAGVYESIVTEFPDEAEAYWGLVLCKYGIEYVDDGKGSKIPTCHRTMPTSIIDDEDFILACDYADTNSKTIYRNEAKAIDAIQKKILQIAATEKPYDIFICYKETDDNTGARTEDSSIAQDIYTQLIKDGYKVFFSRVTLREVAGTEYEPYIYAALSSAKVMLAIGTRYEYYDAVWVKNEWSRFISMMGDDSTKTLIPCYRNMDAYDMPKEFKNMQALDMGEVTFFASLSTNINRLLPKVKAVVKESVAADNVTGASVDSLLKRAFMFLEDGDWNNANIYCEKILDIDPENAQAYLGELLIELKVSKFEKLSEFHTTFSDNKNYEKIMRFADSELKERVKNCNDIIARRLEEARKKKIYERAIEIMRYATTVEMFEKAGYSFQEVMGYADAKKKSEECFKKAKKVRIELERQTEVEKQRAEKEEKDRLYSSACAVLDDSHPWISQESDIKTVEAAIVTFENLGGWRDSEQKIQLCKKKIEEIQVKIEAEREEQERKIEELRRISEAKAKRNKKVVAIGTGVVTIMITFVIVLNAVVKPYIKYNKAMTLIDEGNFTEAYDTLISIVEYKNSKDYLLRFTINCDKKVCTASNGEVTTCEFTYDDSGNCTKAVEKSSNGYSCIYEYSYNSEGDCTKVVNPSSENGYSVEYIYDNDGNCVKQVYTSSDLDATYEYLYDDKGYLIKELCTYSNGITSNIEYTYGNDGYCIKEVEKFSSGEKTTTEYTYNKNGGLTKEVSIKSNGEISTKEHRFDNKGGLTKEVFTNSDGENSFKEQTYDSKGLLTKEVSTNFDGDVTTYEYTYYGININYTP